MMIWAVVMSAAALTAPAVAASSDTPAAPPPIEAYGALPSLEMVRLSPSGRRLAFISVIGESRMLAVFDRTTGTSLQRGNAGQVKVRDLQWIDDERVLVTTSTTTTVASLGIDQRELYQGLVFEPDSGRFIKVLDGTRELFPVLMSPVDVVHTEGAPLVFVRAHSFQRPDNLSLYRVDPRNGRAIQAELMGRDVQDYVMDAAGQSVARSDYNQQTKIWSLHLRRGSRFQEVWRTAAPVDLPSLVGLGANGDSVIVNADRPDFGEAGHEDGTFFDVDLETGQWRPLRFDFSPGSLWFHPATRRLIGVSRAEADGRRYLFADGDGGALWTFIQNAFPGQHPELVSWSNNLKAAVVFTSGSNDSGTFHLVDLETNTSIPAGKAYITIPDDQVATITPIKYAASDGLEIQGYLTTPIGRQARDLPLVVLAHGGPAARDSMGFDWWAQALASRGYAVLQANFRGSTGYGRDFMEAGYGEWGRKMQTDLSDGVRHLAAEGVIDPRRVCIAGASYGGYAAMAGPTLDPGVYRCAVSVSGVSDLRRMIQYEAMRGARRDNDAVRYWSRFMGAARANDRALDFLSPAHLASRADAPMLLLHGRDDSVVPIEQSRVMASALRRAGKPVELIELAGEDHWLSRADTRRRMLTETVRFLEQHNPPQ